VAALPIAPALAVAAHRTVGDVQDFLVVNRFARDTPWLHTPLLWFANYGVVLFALLLLLGALAARAAGSSARLAAAVWACLAALIAVGLNQPIVHDVNEPRPFMALRHVLVLAHHSADPGFPSDHATMAGAIAVGVFFASRRLGVVAALAALLLAFARVYVGVHYPRDVAAGLLLGAVVAAVGQVLVVPLLTRVLDVLAASRVGRFALPPRPTASPRS
jgi:membrane-associated phospholipid phosphatase